MFNKKIISSILTRLSSLEKRMMQVQCEHKKVYFIINWNFIRFFKKCRDCDKILKEYRTERDYLFAQANYFSAKARHSLKGEKGIIIPALPKKKKEKNKKTVVPLSTKPLTDEELHSIVAELPGGIDGFLKGWGWLHFARAIEKHHGIS